MTESKTFFVVNAIVNKANMQDLQTYLGKIMQVFGKNGGKPAGISPSTMPITGIMPIPSRSERVKPMLELLKL